MGDAAAPRSRQAERREARGRFPAAPGFRSRAGNAHGLGIGANRTPAFRVGFRSAARKRLARRERDLTPYETRLVKLLDQLEATLKEVREHLDQGRSQGAHDPAKAIRAFADEALRDRDA